MNYLKNLIETHNQITVACLDYKDPNIPTVSLYELNSNSKIEEYGFWDDMGKFRPLTAIIKIHPFAH